MPSVVKSYKPSPTGMEFHSCPLNIRGIRGPVGSGKTTALIWEIQYANMRQEPCSDGVIRNRWLIMRNTLPELRDTTVQSWLHWFPQTEMNWTPPYHATLNTVHPVSGLPMETKLIFYGCDQPDFEEKLKSLEITGVWVNEACQVRWTTINEAYKRCGRYPAKEPGKSFISHGLIMDTNSPDDSNWWYKFEVVKRYPEMAFFVQPPALLRREAKDGRVWYEPNRGQDEGIAPAENIEYLNEGYDYYMKQIAGSSDDVIRKLILNQFGTSMEGKPVYGEWNDHVHWAGRDIDVDFGLPVFIGQDFGRTPASVIVQMGMNGQLRVLEEVVSDGMGITQFVQERLRPLLVTKYRLLEGAPILCFADPAGANPDQVDPYSCIQRMNMAGIKTVPCPGIPKNTFMLRRDAVADLLRSQRDGQPAIIVGNRCPMLRKGFNGGYCYKKYRGTNGGDDVYSNEVDKHNPYSHPHDALQYAVLGAMRQDGSSGFGGDMARRFGLGSSGLLQPETGCDFSGFY